MSSLPHSKSDPSNLLWWTEVRGDSPVVAVAVHSSPVLVEALGAKSKLDINGRLREEDPFTDQWAEVAANRLIAHRSRFGVDLNRPREKAVYLKPEDAWELDLWEVPPTGEELDESLAYYDAFYANAERFLRQIQEQFGKFVVLDLHTYNHLREGEKGPPADPEANPEVNIGTKTLKDRGPWESIIKGFMEDLGSYDFNGRNLDVRENVKFGGGQFSRWVHETFPENSLSLAIEFKKFFMNEWTGEGDETQIRLIHEALASTIPNMAQALAK